VQCSITLFAADHERRLVTKAGLAALQSIYWTRRQPFQVVSNGTGEALDGAAEAAAQGEPDERDDSRAAVPPCQNLDLEYGRDSSIRVVSQSFVLMPKSSDARAQSSIAQLAS